MKSYLAIKKVVPDEVVVKVRLLPFSSTTLRPNLTLLYLTQPYLTLKSYLALWKVVVLVE